MEAMKTETKKSWRDVIEIHPAADVFPVLAEDELRKLAEDIKKNGLRERVITFSLDGEGDVLLDGRNRLDAMELVGMNVIGDDGKLKPNIAVVDMLINDPAAYVISKNIRRRHLTPEQQVALAADVLGLWKPNKTAKATGGEASQAVKPHGRKQPKGAVKRVSEVTGLDKKTARKHLTKIVDEKVKSKKITKEHAEAIVPKKVITVSTTYANKKIVIPRVTIINDDAETAAKIGPDDSKWLLNGAINRIATAVNGELDRAPDRKARYALAVEIRRLGSKLTDENSSGATGGGRKK